MDLGNQLIRTHYLGHVTGYQPIRDQYLMVANYLWWGNVDSTSSLLVQLLNVSVLTTSLNPGEEFLGQHNRFPMVVVLRGKRRGS